MIIRATYTPTDTKAHETWDIDYDELTVEDIMTIERISGETLGDFEASIRVGSKTSLMQLLYVWRSRTEADLTFSDVSSIRFRDLAFFNPEADAPKESGEPAAEDPEAPTQ